jgi:hypothetical protein
MRRNAFRIIANETLYQLSYTPKSMFNERESIMPARASGQAEKGGWATHALELAERIGNEDWGRVRAQ